MVGPPRRYVANMPTQYADYKSADDKDADDKYAHDKYADDKSADCKYADDTRSSQRTVRKGSLTFAGSLNPYGSFRSNGNPNRSPESNGSLNF